MRPARGSLRLDVGPTTSSIDNSRPELVLLKLHGSIDWFDKAPFDEHVALAKRYPAPYVVQHPVFGPESVVSPVRLVDGPRDVDDPLSNVYRVRGCDGLRAEFSWSCAPLILAPSSAKLLYASPLRGFWWGMQRAGGWNLGLAIIGYSLPPHDSYARQALYRIADNYTEFEPDLSFDGRKKQPIRIVDFYEGASEHATIRQRYRFLDWGRTELLLTGFSSQSADWVLA